MYTLKMNGVTYEVTRDKDGNKVYNPPLPEEKQEKWDENIDEIVETGVFPGLQTDGTFHQGRGTLLDQLEGDQVWVDHITREAKKRGRNVGANDVYIGQMAAFPGDPDAFFSPDEGRAELKRRAEKKNMTIDAPGVSVEGKDRGEAEATKLNPKFAKKIAKNMRKAGQADGMSDKQLMDHVVKKHGRKD